MRQSLDQFEVAFEEEAAVERLRRRQLRQRAVDRSRARRIDSERGRTSASGRADRQRDRVSWLVETLPADRWSSVDRESVGRGVLHGPDRSIKDPTGRPCRDGHTLAARLSTRPTSPQPPWFPARCSSRSKRPAKLSLGGIVKVRRVALADQLGVDEQVADVDVGEQPTVDIAALRVELQAHILAADEALVEAARLRGRSTRPAGRGRPTPACRCRCSARPPRTR